MPTHPLPRPSKEQGWSEEYLGGLRPSRPSLKARRTSRVVPEPERGKLRPFHLGALLAVLLLVVWNTTGSDRPYSSSEEDANARFTIFLVAEAVNAYRDSTGTLPTSLEPLGVDVTDCIYWTDGDMYSLTVDLGNREVTYHAGEPLLPYATAFDRVIPGE